MSTLSGETHFHRTIHTALNQSVMMKDKFLVKVFWRTVREITHNIVSEVDVKNTVYILQSRLEVDLYPLSQRGLDVFIIMRYIMKYLEEDHKLFIELRHRIEENGGDTFIISRRKITW